MKAEEVSDLIGYRLQEAKTALDDADFLLKGNRSQQSIVNRLYYAMFYAALALLQRIGRIPSKHAGVIGIFDSEFALKGVFPKDMSKSFHRAFELRQVSDYRVVKPLSPEEIETLRRNAADFVSRVVEYLSQDGSAR
jgi:uncharacterized protein (UPF0332 family)